MRDLPPIARRARALAIVVGLLASSLPLVTLAQEEPTLAVSDAFEITGDSSQGAVEVGWTITESDPRWRLEASRPGEEHIDIRLRDAAGNQLTQAGGRGEAALFDLALESGEYSVQVAGSQAEPGFTLVAAPESVLYDPEPNDQPRDAAPLEQAVDVTGRLTGQGSDEDRFVFSIPPADTDVRVAAIEPSNELEHILCLEDEAGVSLQCRRGVGRVALTDLALRPGRYLLRVAGSNDAAAGYRLRLEAVGPRQADREAEPNDDFATASSFDVALGVSGTTLANDIDHHVVSLDGEPQLWQVRASGPQVLELGLVRGSRGSVALSQPRGNGEDAVLDDLILGRGDHVLAVRARDGDYRLTMTPLGPPDPEAEREPNNADIRAEAFRIGERRTGRLPSVEDIDFFRFTLAAPDHVRLTLEQPSDADLDITLSGAGREVLRGRADSPGEPIDLDLTLPPGDYLVRLRAQAPSEGTYALTSEHLDPFAWAVDQEPNDRRIDARPVPPSLTFSGDRQSRETDPDWFILPSLTTPSTLTIHHAGDPLVTRLFAGPEAEQRLETETVEEGVLRAPDVPADTPLYLQLEGAGAYELRLEAAGWEPLPDPPDPSVEMTLELDHDTVAAYWPAGQRVAGTVGLANTGAEDLQLSLETATSHYGWEATLASAEVAVAAGETATVPLDLLIGPDAWADFPVQLAVAARTDDGGRRTVRTSLDASPDAPAVSSYLAWPVPAELLGGLNVAGTALGAVPIGLIDPDREALLFDGVTPSGAGFMKSVELPAEFVVDLAGDTPVPIRGTILNPLAQQSAIDRTPARFELLLSEDGATWTSVLEDELLPLGIDQAFVLDEPVPATQAMLRVLDLHGEVSPTLALGEWKVVAEPGVVPTPMPLDIADPVRGGHVARHEPYAGGQDRWYGMLDRGTRRYSARFEPDAQDELEIVVGFESGRAAQITGLSWLDPDGSDEKTRVDSVEVEVGLDGPLGPWRSVGAWMLERGAPGEAMRFDLDQPVWARFVRLRGALPDEGRNVELPATIEVLERATDADYRSILGEWGYGSDAGPYEWLVPQAVEAIELDADAGDTLESATPLELGTTRADEAEIMEDVDWYRIDVPEGDNTLELEVQGLPATGVRLSLVDAEGQPHDLRSWPLPGGIERYQAIVEPGPYHLLVEQPPFNVAFTFDTSGSMGPFLDYVLEGTREFAADVEPGREVAHIIPVDELPLLDGWSDQPLRLQDAVNNYVPDLNAAASNIEVGLLLAAELLADREGTRAILAVGDAETGSLDLANDVWAAFRRAGPVVYTVHVGASNRPRETRDLMRSWSAGNGGVYSYPTSHAEMERSFERMSTRLRRPATYLLTASTAAVDREPARLSVLAPPDEPTALAAGVGVGIILDTSGSMNKRLEGQRRIDIAKGAMKRLIRRGLAEGVPVSLRIFGGEGKRSGCRTRQLVPLGPLDKAATVQRIERLRIRKNTGTPIAAALRWVERDLASVEGQRIVVLITDGKATCEADPEAALAELRAAGIEVSLTIVGFALDDEALKAQMRGWAEATGGSFYDAGDAAALTQAVTLAVAAPVEVYALADEEAPVATTTVGAPAVELPPGTYRVVVRSEPVQEFEEVTLDGGSIVALELQAADGE